ncbi:polysaccharide deacetylase family protein [Alkalihalobacillus sp. TS-13]|uniref:polysaccharide deacetylase family protein n=1 Tax=Alkalihalobacillus sp. TS-13 TaxID=2842455 RepID=UPI001C880B96|nr:polysaccharide deacetylase family protein [Alkalihalobacillus sp. TS-13]
MRRLFIFAFACLFMTMSLVACSFPVSGLQENQDNETERQPEHTREQLSNKDTNEEIDSQPQTEDPDGKLVEYHGPVEHIFFHPTIVYPELAFDYDAMAKGYNDYFVTVDEFKRTLDELHKNDYILIDINSLVEEKEDGKIVTRQLMLPEGKKPLVLSIDDMNYYDYMRKNGNVYKLVLDEEGEVASYEKTLEGKELITRDHAIVPILEQFVEEHPDFSFNGAKGLIALTGYEGVLGYRTNELNSVEIEDRKQEALKVIKRLKETGWSFASHGYGHLDANKVGYHRLADDTHQWKEEVEVLIGGTDVYIYPYGSRVETGGAKFKDLVETGFKILCGVGPEPYMEVYEDSAIMMDRRHIDGIALQTQKDRLAPLLDADNVLENEVRPEY